MKRLMTAVAVGALMAVGLSAQEKGKEAQAPPEFKPQKEHEWLRAFEGTWEAQGSMKDESGVEHRSKGTETVRSVLGGFWTLMEFKGEMDGKPFDGHGMIGFDPGRGKYVSTWMNSCSPCFMKAEGRADPVGNLLSLEGDTYDPKTGKKTTLRLVHELRSRDARKLTFYAPGPDGSTEQAMGEITYTRKK